MYPLLAAGASAVATNLLESVGSMVQRKLTATSQPTGANAAPGQLGAQGAASFGTQQPSLREQIASLRARLMDSPELQTLVNTSGAETTSSLSLSPGGIVSYTAQDGRATALTLSPETAEVARSLGSLFSQANGAATSGTFSLAAAPRPTLNVYA